MIKLKKNTKYGYLLIFEKIFNTSKRIELVIKDNNSDRIEINEESWELKGK
jgi:hypothetical protein